MRSSRFEPSGSAGAIRGAPGAEAMSNPMVLHDVMGFAAVASALLAAAQKPALRMRLAAVTSNFLFITYGAMGPAYPTLLLHSDPPAAQRLAHKSSIEGPKPGYLRYRDRALAAVRELAEPQVEVSRPA